MVGTGACLEFREISKHILHPLVILGVGEASNVEGLLEMTSPFLGSALAAEETTEFSVSGSDLEVVFAKPLLMELKRLAKPELGCFDLPRAFQELGLVSECNCHVVAVLAAHTAEGSEGLV